MRTTILFLYILAPLMTLWSQSADKNYVITRTMTSANGNTYLEKIEYFDDLGRPRQTIQRNMSPTGNDWVNFQGYDSSARKAETWLPTPMTTNGNFVDSIVFSDNSKKFYADKRPFSAPTYDDSPLNRVIRTYGPGEDWYNAGSYNGTAYQTNTSSDACKYYSINTWGYPLSKTNYDAGELYITQNKDENGHIIQTFADKLGRTVLVREKNGTENLDCYYVYDGAGQLQCVLPPMLGENGNIGLVPSFAYIYSYDRYRRCYQKKLPGCQPVQFVCDMRDHIIMSQDGNQATTNKWNVIKYDKFGRIAYSCEMEITDAAPTIRNFFLKNEAVESFTTASQPYPMGDTGYSCNYYHDVPATLQIVNYYDDYRFLDLLPNADKAQLEYREQPGYDKRYSSAKGKLTGTRNYNTDGTGFTTTVYYYDSNGNMIQTAATNYLKGYDRHFYQLTFTGKVSGERHEHINASGFPTIETYIYGYDHAERLTSGTHFLNMNEMGVPLFHNEYDELGRLKSKYYEFNKTKAMNYTYNIRNWQTSMTSPLYSENIAYDHIGNVKAYQWRFQEEPNQYQQYNYTYDELNRLKNADYIEINPTTGMADCYNVQIGDYDKNGNILSLRRRGINYYESKPARIVGGTSYDVIDDLTLTYNGNQITAITDVAQTQPAYKGAMHFVDGAQLQTEYKYDANGNMIYDANKGIEEITYTNRNLPKDIQFKATSQGYFKISHSIHYTYDATGKKLQAAYATHGTPILTTGTTAGGYSQVDSYRTYADNTIYENDTLNKIIIPDGYISKGKGSIFEYHYYIKDYLGNNRVVISSRGKAEQVNHYYPFGGLFGTSTEGSLQSYKYAGKELEKMHGLEWYDFGARNQDPVVGRFWTIDPLCERYYPTSPYAYCLNNPLKYIDPLGEDIYGFDLFTGQLSLVEMTNDPFDRIMNGSFNDEGVFTPDNENNYLDITGGILKGKYFDDLSYSGIVFQEGNLSEGINVMKFLSFNSHLEFSAWAYKSSSGVGLSISQWIFNKPKKKEDGTIITPAEDFYSVGDRVGYLGDKLFHIHTHPGLKNGMGGNGEPSPADFSRIKIHPNYPHYIISKKDGIIQYYLNGTWKKSAIK